MSRHTVRLHKIVIGHSELESADPSLGRARGQFRPGVGYELVQPVFHLYSEAVPSPGGAVADQDKLDRYHKAREALGLSLEDERGSVIRTSAIHIADYSGNRSGGIELDVLISDREYWRRRNGSG